MKQFNKNSFVMLLPWMLVFLVFWLYPLLYSGYLSLNSYHSLTRETYFIGFDNYIRMFSDKLFWKALYNTCIFTLGTVPFTTIIALILAVLLNNNKTRFKNFFKIAFFLPTVTSLVVLSLIFTNFYAKHGFINIILSMLGLPYPKMGWLLDINTSLLAVMIMDVWSACGYYMLIFLAALQTIPTSIYDSAKLAGASSFYTLTKLTIPLLKPTFIFVLIINIIKSFQIFMEIYIMTKGGPLHSSTTLVYMIFINGFDKTDAMGYASAISYFLFFLLLVLSFFQLSFMKK
jgi:multiple sugar transport system permease protein